MKGHVLGFCFSIFVPAGAATDERGRLHAWRKIAKDAKIECMRTVESPFSNKCIDMCLESQTVQTVLISNCKN